MLTQTLPFFDLEALWRYFQQSLAEIDEPELVGQLVQQCGNISLHIGLVRANEERAIWLEALGNYRLPVGLRETMPDLWLTAVEHPQHSLLVVVLTNPVWQEEFSNLAQSLLQLLRMGDVANPVTVLAQALAQWHIPDISPIYWQKVA